MRLAPAVLALIIATGVLTSPAAAADDDKVPYWASLSADVANMRVGPGDSYKIAWVYRRKHLPVKVVRREGPWRLVEDPAGEKGWMRDLLLSRERSAIVTGDGLVEVHAEAKDESPMRWRVEPGVVGLIDDCRGGWCPIDIAGHKGFVREGALWGAGAP